MSELKLLPCPFCGGEAVLETTIGRKGYDACVFCNCSASVCSVTCDDVSEAEIGAIAAWNRRAQPENSRQHALQTGVCPMCEDCPDGCPVETPNDSRNRPENERLTLEEREKGCAFCDEEHDQHDYMNGVQTFENGKYLVLETSEWDEYDDCFNDVRIRIGFCPMCGRRLERSEE